MLRRFRSKFKDDVKDDIKDDFKADVKADDGEPPTFVDERLVPYLVNTIIDWQIVNGVMLKHRDGDSIKAVPVNISLVPTTFPESMFKRAQGLQKAYNELYAKVSTDDDWLLGVLGVAADEDELIYSLIEMYTRIKREGFVQDLTLGIFRSDYMLHLEAAQSESDESSSLSLKQVEFNTVATAGGCHAANAARVHAYLAKKKAFQQHGLDVQLASLPQNPAIDSLVSALASAHTAYGPPKSSKAKETAVLMIVQPFNLNIADERPLEYGLLDSSVPVHRCSFRWEVLKHTSLTDSRELLYHPPFRQGLPPLEISVVYYRAGLDAREFDQDGQATRLHLERSAAIKCPDILAQLAGAKIVQQELSMSAVLERFVNDGQTREELSRSFGKMFPLDNSDFGKQGQSLALDRVTAKKYVLKPCREGGGNNIYGEDIPAYLRSMPPSAWPAHMLMELFNPPKQEGKIMTSSGIYEGEVVSELGIIGTCLWRRNGEVVENSGAAGWTFKTKPPFVNEMSVVKGYGCFDCPRLVDG